MTDHSLSRWLGQPVGHWRTEWRLPALHVFERLPSTNDLARQLARDGAPHATTLLADEQTAGRGRQGRVWTAPRGSSLLLSMILRPASPAAEVLLSIRLGLAAARAIEAIAPVRVGLKWPNDLLIDGRKVAGILCEGGRDAAGGAFVVGGIGVNVNQSAADWPPELHGQAVSLRQCTGDAVDRARLAGHIVAAWTTAARCDTDRLEPDEIEAFRHRDVLIGRPITVNDRPAGIARGIRPDGSLSAGPPHEPRRFIAGTVRIRDTALEGAP